MPGLDTNKVLRPNDRSEDVKTLQTLLNSTHSFNLDVDGHYGPQTQAAIETIQTLNQFKIDGICGPQTLKLLLDNKPEIKAVPETLLTEGLYTVETAAKELGCEVAAIKAVSAVESAGAGFLKSGEPKILFERHWFYKQLKKHGYPADAIAAKNPDICSKSPGGYKGGAEEHTRLARAIAIHESSALEAASWGAYQIMGFHWESLGYASVQDFVENMRESEGRHLEAFVRFILKNKNLLNAIRTKNWPKFALNYNGTNYEKNAYDKKMASNYLKFA